MRTIQRSSLQRELRERWLLRQIGPEHKVATKALAVLDEAHWDEWADLAAKVASGESPHLDKTDLERLVEAARSSRCLWLVQPDEPVIALRAPFDEDVRIQVELVGKWHPFEWYWEVRGQNIGVLTSFLQAFPQGKWLVEALAELGIDAESLLPPVHPDFEGDLRPYQRLAATWAAYKARCLLADEQGLGKTRTALAAAALRDTDRLLILTPACAKWVWSAEAESVLSSWDIFTCDSRRVKNLVLNPPWPAMAIINYDIIAKHLDILSDFLDQGERPALIVDESHYVKTPGYWNHKTGRAKGSQRTAATTVLAEEVRERDGMVLLLSGTPVVNRPAELIPQLQILDKLETLGGWHHFATRYCGGYQDIHGWKLERATHVDELSLELRRHVMLRRTKAQVAKELPAKAHHLLQLEPDRSWMAEYAKAERDILTYVAERAQALAIQLGQNPRSAGVRAAMRAEAARHLVRLANLRRIIGMAKVAPLVEWIKDRKLDSTGMATLEGRKLNVGKTLIFAHHQSVITELAKHLKADTLTGKGSATKNTDLIEAFQNDPKRQILVCSTNATGVGVTLTAADTVVFAELSWTPAAHAQAEDRAHRIGQTRQVNVYTAVVHRTVDSFVGDLLHSKANVVDALMEGRPTGKFDFAGDLMLHLLDMSEHMDEEDITETFYVE